jgi:hypothetical protein
MKEDLNFSELSRHLGPVKAPDSLWDRVQGAGVSSRERRPARAITWQWATVALATVAVVAGVTFWSNRSLTSEELAVRALSRSPSQMEFRSGDLAELRTWIKAGTGLDLPFPGHLAPSVHLVGAHVSRKGIPTAEISYRVGDVDATLVVSKAPADGDGRHTFKKSGSYHGAHFQSWTMRGQMYTIAAANASKGCMLCHSTGPPRMPAVN